MKKLVLRFLGLTRKDRRRISELNVWIETLDIWNEELEKIKTLFTS